MLLPLELKMTNQHPIQPSPVLVDQWSTFIYQVTGEDHERDFYIATQAAQWGAEQELHAICDWLDHGDTGYLIHPLLCAQHHPKPPSLRKQAYDALDTYIYGEPDPKDKERTYNTIRRALEALPND